MTAGTIVALFRPDVKGAPPVALATADIVADLGIAGDRHGKPGSKRQVLLIDRALIDRFGLQPGDLDENLTIAGLPVDELQPGQRVRIGTIVLETTIPCPVCDKLDTVRYGLRTALRDQRGIFTRVLHGGTVHIGDRVIVEARPPATYPPSRRGN